MKVIRFVHTFISNALPYVTPRSEPSNLALSIASNGSHVALSHRLLGFLFQFLMCTR